MKIKEFITEMAERMSDIVTARALIGQALADPRQSYKYFNFIKMLRKNQGPEYSTHVHQQAVKLAKEKQ